MAKELEDLVKQLVDALNKSSDRLRTSNRAPKEGEKSASDMSPDDLNTYLQDRKNKLSELEKKEQFLKQISNETIDSELLINEAREERLRIIKEEFRENQLDLIKLKEKLSLLKDQNTKEAEDLKAKIAALEAVTRHQGKALENAKKEEKIRETIVSLSKDLLNNALKYGQQLEEHIMNISKLNGGYAELDSKLREANRQVYEMTAGSGIMVEEANAAFASLSKNFIGLTTQSEESIALMVKGSAELTKIGVSGEAATKGMDGLVNAMGKTPQQAYKIQESFTQMAAKNRLAIGAVSQAFADNMGRFVSYGDQATEVLKGLAEQSLKTGVSINSLVSIAQQFDTFESAAKAVGNLNALMGGDYLNSIELMTASDDERIKILKDGIKASGMQWESMNRFQKMAFANAAGIKDLNEAGKILGQTSLQNTKQQEEAAKVQKTLAEQAESVSTSMDKMKSAINGVIIALDPLVSVVGWLVENFILGPIKLAKFISELGNFGNTAKQVTTVLGSLVSLYLILETKNLLMGKGFLGLGKTITGAVSKLWSWITAKKAANALPDLNTAGPSAAAGSAANIASGPASATSGFLANAGNMAKAAGAILLFSAALFVLAKALQEFSDDKINAKGVVIALVAILGIVRIAKLLEKVAISITTGVIAIALIAGSLFLLGLALEKFVKIDWKILAGIGAIILGLGLAIAGFGAIFSNPITGAALAIGLLTLTAIAAAIGLLGSGLMKVIESIEKASPSLSNLAMSFKELFSIKDLESNFSKLESFLSQLSNIDIEPINNLANSIGLLAENLQKLVSTSLQMSVNVKGTTTTEMLDNITQLTQQTATPAMFASTAAISAQTAAPQQIQTYVPLMVSIDKKAIIEILTEDIENISEYKADQCIDTLGLTKSARTISYRNKVNP